MEAEWLQGLDRDDLFWSFLPRYDISNRIPIETKVCGLCGKEFLPKESYARLICYSKECTYKYDKAKRAIMREREIEERKIRDREKEIAFQAEIAESVNKRNCGYVYLMRSGNGYYKIGISKKVEGRLDGLKRQFPVEIEVIHYIASKQYRDVERYLHRKYESKRIEYEWFNLESKDIKWIKSLKDYDLDL